MDISRYILEKDSYYYLNKANRKTLLTDADISKLLIDSGTSIENLSAEIVNWKNKIAEITEKNLSRTRSQDEELVSRKIAIVQELQPFKYLKLLRNKSLNQIILLWDKDNDRKVLGTIDALNDKDLTNVLSEFYPEILVQLQTQLGPCVSPKDPTKITNIQLVQTCINILNPCATLERIEIETGDIHPATVETSEIFSLKKIPYKVLPGSDFYGLLSDKLQEFLGRVENHEHLCAILWGQFIGKSWPYIIYLYGKQGREGKTAFINMLGKLVGSFATITEHSSRFSLGDIYGKSIIMVPENDKTRLISSKLMKSITGGNLLNIEYRYKGGFSGKIRGTIIVDANVPLNISGKAFEVERLRYFTVSAPTINDTLKMAPEEYTNALGATPNEFLNYCRECYEKLILPGGMLKLPPNHKALMEMLGDYEQEFSYQAIFHKTMVENKLEIGDQLEYNMNWGEFIYLTKLLLKSEEKREFYTPGYKEYLESRGCVVRGRLIYGIGFNVHTTSYSPPTYKEPEV